MPITDVDVTDSFAIQPLDSALSVVETLRRFQDCPFLLLLDSVGQIRERDSRYTVLTADPVDTFRLDHAEYGVDPFVALRIWQQQLPTITFDHPPFCGGIAGFLAYELGQAFERLPTPARDDFQTPAMLAGLFDWSIVWDHLTGSVTLWVLRLPRGVGRTSPEDRLGWVQQRLTDKGPGLAREDRSQTVKKAAGEVRSGGHPLPLVPDVYSSFTPDGYLAAVERVIEYIRSGDVFQANLSQQLTAAWPGTSVDLYERVREQNPAPFCGLLQADDFAVVSASPERFLKVARGRWVESRPIKGTRRRHRSPIADLFTGQELLASEKDRAENVMIVDLLRNDISRVCDPGTVKVTGLCEVEVFRTVQHLVSTVVGELRSDQTVWDLCAAAIPGGSITGAPKIRAMQIIAELEPIVRGAYCGNLFCLGPSGDFDSSILIRTFTLKDGWVQFPAGGGIVADSQPAEEYRETLHKAAAMLRVLKGAEPPRFS